MMRTSTPTTRCLLRDALATPVGQLTVIFDQTHVLHAVDWEDHEHRLQHLFQTRDRRRGRHTEFQSSKMSGYLRDSFEGYFNGGEIDITKLKVELDGTPFEETVWRALLTIPRGETRSYGDIAKQIGKPTASRAVGAANGRNPIGIVVPCHRVIGQSGSLTGYGGGLSRKAWLLDLEQASPN